MTDSDVLAALTPVAEAFASLAIAFRVSGSVASSALGVPRSTLDVDLVARMSEAQAAPLAARLSDRFYADADMIRDATRRRGSFNLVHLATMLKVDVFVLKDRPFDQAAFRRQVAIPLAPGGRPYPCTTAEDAILHKLEWYKLGGATSDRQWHDVLGIISVQAGALDLAWMRHWAQDLGVEDLLARALAHASPPLDPGRDEPD